MFGIDGNKFVAAFLEKGVSQKDFAQQTGLSGSTVKKLLRGDRVNSKSLSRAADFLGVKGASLLKGDVTQ